MAVPQAMDMAAPRAWIILKRIICSTFWASAQAAIAQGENRHAGGIDSGSSNEITDFSEDEH